MNQKLLPFVCILSLLSSAFAHVYKLGECPQVQAQKDFDMKRFLGEWFVVQRFQTSNSCIRENITFDGQEFYIRETLKPAFSNFGLEFQTAKVGRLILANATGGPGGALKVDYSLNPLGPSDFMVISTDYDNYAAVWSCQKMLWSHRQSGQIMSRTRALDREVVQKLRRMFVKFSINEHEFSFIDQHRCDPNEGFRKRVGKQLRAKKERFMLRLGSFEIFSRR